MMQERESANLRAVEPDKLGLADSKRTSPVRVEFNMDNKLLLRLVLTIAVLLLAWSWFTELDEITQAPGQIIPSEQVHPIRAGFDSKIEAIFVKAGDFVKKGDLLLKLDAKSYRAELEKYQQEFEIAKQELARHESAIEILDAYLKNPGVLPTDLSSITDVARAISDLYSAHRQLERAQLDMKLSADNSTPEFGALKSQRNNIAEQRRLRQEALASRKKHFLLEENKLNNQLASLERQVELQKMAVEKQQNSLECTEKQLAAYERVLKIGASSRTECLDARIRMEDQEKQLTAAEARARELEGQLESTRHELSELKSNNAVQAAQLEATINDISSSATQIRSRMRGVEREYNLCQASYHVAWRAASSTQASELSVINNFKKQIEQLSASISSEEHSFLKGELRSPVDGTVSLINFQGIGEVVHHGQDLLTIVPAHEHLIASINVPNEQIAFLHKGEVIKLQFPAYPYQQYGTIKAVISMIDAYPAEDNERPPTYVVFLEPQRDWIRCRGKKIPLREGLEVEAQLVLRKRRLLVSILAPLLKLRYEHFKA